ncbi:MAG TPA: dihydrodipicolinate reductase [Thermoanaerobaculia bacterium]|nr:dihydrodipicolinate reductase [Thermoanaerobaculia bacterium]
MKKPFRARVALVGLGPIGIEIGKALVGRRGIEILGAADPAAERAGHNFYDLVDSSGPALPVDSSASSLYARRGVDRQKIDVAVLCTRSRLDSVMPQLEEAIEAGLHVVSTCEELAYPELKNAVLAHRIDQRAKEHCVAVLGTGVNPGLVMDRLALAAAGACVRVDRVKVTRVVDVAKRRGPLRAKVGAGLTHQEFAKGVAEKRLGHVGLSESAAIIAVGLGLPIDEITETIEPVVGEQHTDDVPAGRVLGLHQVALVQAGDEVKVVLDLTMAVGVSDASDAIDIEGDPPVHLRISGGFHGDRATVGCVVNAIPFIVDAPAGLHKVVTLPLFGLFPEPTT